MESGESAMDTDEQSSLLTTSNLRRSNSAPLISTGSISDNTPVFQPISFSRQRRFSMSTSYATLNNMPLGSPASRIDQLRREDSIDQEVAHERGLISEYELSNSCLELSLMDGKRDEVMEERHNSFEHPSLSIYPSPTKSSPSPTKFLTKQAQSRRSLTPSPIPSPTRQAFRRSHSPVCRPNSFNFKRKYPSDGFDSVPIAPKRTLNSEFIQLHGYAHTPSPDDPPETAHLSFDDDLSDTSSSSSSTTTFSTPPNRLLYCDTSLQATGVVKSRCTPPRSPLAGPSTTQCTQNKVPDKYVRPPCFSFTPVKD